ncbi:MAG: DUF736 domain-containing protein [Pseudomonadota bacterium]
MIIGKFTSNETGYTGHIKTLMLTIPLQVVVNDRKSKPEQPDYNVFSGETEIGAGWNKVSADAENYISIAIDDPSFPATMYFSIVKLHEKDQILVWSRQKAKKSTTK